MVFTLIKTLRFSAGLVITRKPEVFKQSINALIG